MGDLGGGLPPADLRPRIRALHLFVLNALTAGHNFFLFTRSDVAYTVRRGLSDLEMVAVGFLVLAILPGVMVAVEAIVGRLGGVRAVWRAHLAFVTFFFAMLGVEAAAQLEGGSLGTAQAPPAMLVGFAVAGGALGLFLYRRFVVARSFISFAAIGIPLLLIGFLVAVPWGESGDAPVAGARTPETPVVLIVFDEFPLATITDGVDPPSLDAEHFPAFGELASDATWFPNATTVHEFSRWAIPAMITGYLSDGRHPHTDIYPESVAGLFGRDASILTVEPITEICPESACERLQPRDTDGGLAKVLYEAYAMGLFSNFLVSFELIDDRWPGWEAKPEASVEPALERMAADSFDLAFLHLELPHTPWVHYPNGAEYIDKGLTLVGRTPPDEAWPTRLINRRHFLQAQYTDRILARIVTTLKQAGTYEDSLLIVTSDHGASFVPGEKRRTIGSRTFSEIVNVPLFVKPPGDHRGRVSETFARGVDVLPTIADQIGVAPTWEVEGRSLLGPERPRPEVIEVGVEGFGRSDESEEMRTSRFLRQREIVAERRRRWQPWLPLWRQAPREIEAAIGRSESWASARGWEAVDAEIEDRDRLDPAVPSDGKLPGLVRATVEDGGPGDYAALVLGGRIVGVAPLFADDGETRFEVLVGEREIRRGGGEPHLIVSP